MLSSSAWNSFSANLRTSDRSLTCVDGNFIVRKFEKMKKGKINQFQTSKGNWLARKKQNESSNIINIQFKSYGGDRSEKIMEIWQISENRFLKVQRTD